MNISKHPHRITLSNITQTYHDLFYMKIMLHNKTLAEIMNKKELSVINLLHIENQVKKERSLSHFDYVLYA